MGQAEHIWLNAEHFLFPVTSALTFLQSLVKSSWESRDQPTIIPQGVPYMVKLLRYYVSEDAVYLHLEHVKGQRLIQGPVVPSGFVCANCGSA